MVRSDMTGADMTLILFWTNLHKRIIRTEGQLKMALCHCDYKLIISETTSRSHILYLEHWNSFRFFRISKLIFLFNSN